LPSSTQCKAGFVIYQSSIGAYYTDVINSSTGNGLSYLWDFGDGTATSNSQSPTHTYYSSGPHNLCLTVDDGNGCIDTYCDSIGIYGSTFKQSIFQIKISSSNPIGINEYNLSEMKLFPNPTNGSINIDLGETLSKVKVTFTNSLGQVILCERFASTNFISLEIDAPKGIYFLQLQTESGEVITKKIVKE
jgi:hypothetical protein